MYYTAIPGRVSVFVSRFHGVRAFLEGKYFIDKLIDTADIFVSPKSKPGNVKGYVQY